MKSKLFSAVLGIALLSIPSMVKDVVHNKQVQFDKGTNGTTEKGKIKGYEYKNATWSQIRPVYACKFGN